MGRKWGALGSSTGRVHSLMRRHRGLIWPKPFLWLPKLTLDFAGGYPCCCKFCRDCEGQAPFNLEIVISGVTTEVDCDGGTCAAINGTHILTGTFISIGGVNFCDWHRTVLLACNCDDEDERSEYLLDAEFTQVGANFFLEVNVTPCTCTSELTDTCAGNIGAEFTHDFGTTRPLCKFPSGPIAMTRQNLVDGGMCDWTGSSMTADW